MPEPATPRKTTTKAVSVGNDVTLRTPFPPEQIGKLPKGNVMLDYVGHADITARLLDVDPDWTWEPMAVTDSGLPMRDEFGNLWIRLTVLGVTRIGVGDGKNAKECIGDALRNAAMRFGCALELWAKGDRQYTDATPGAHTSDDGQERLTAKRGQDTAAISTDTRPAALVPEDPEIQELILDLYAAGQEDNPAEVITGLAPLIAKHKDVEFTTNGFKRTIQILQDACLSGKLKGRTYQP